MKLYYAPGACSLAIHIALREAGLPFTLERVDMRAGTAHGVDFKTINPKGYVPALRFEDGEVMSEGVALQVYVAEQKPEAGLIPKEGRDRYRAIEWLTFISSELHKGFSPLFDPEFPADQKARVIDKLGKRFTYVAECIEKNGGAFLMGSRFHAPDAYLFTVLGWTKAVNIDLSPWPVLTSYLERVRARPSVQAAWAAEGLKG